MKFETLTVVDDLCNQLLLSSKSCAIRTTTMQVYHATFINTMSLSVSRKKLCGLITTRQAEVLKPLQANKNKRHVSGENSLSEPGWCRCRDIGGYRDSHHSLTLRRLAAKGLVETTSLVSERLLEKPLLVYRVTAEGSSVWAEYVMYSEHALIAHPKPSL